jgi:hypothetical protein
MRSDSIGLIVVVLSAWAASAPHQGVTHTSCALSGNSTLTSWNDTPVERSIGDFATRMTTPESTDFVPRAERIAVFNLDGTLWVEQSAAVQLVFTLQRVKPNVLTGLNQNGTR